MTQNITSWITTVSLVFGVLTLRASQRQRLRQFETMYVQRYWSLMDGLSLHALRSDPLTAVDAEDEKVVRQYLRLCEDQLELRKEGWISTATWKIWANGMEAQLHRTPFDIVWREIRDNNQNEYSLLRLQLQEPKRDPCQMSWIRRQLAGLGGRPTI